MKNDLGRRTLFSRPKEKKVLLSLSLSLPLFSEQTTQKKRNTHQNAAIFFDDDDRDENDDILGSLVHGGGAD
jgi:hypothetical protein